MSEERLKQERLKKGYLQWRCRRGTKELDVMLNNFLDAYYDKLSDKELQDFDELLNAQDTNLWYWLSGQQQCLDEKLNSIVAKASIVPATSVPKYNV